MRLKITLELNANNLLAIIKKGNQSERPSELENIWIRGWWEEVQPKFNYIDTNIM